MYSEAERSEILNKLIDDFKNREEIISVILVGSGAIGFRDKLSDLDIAVVVDNTDNIDDIFAKTKEEVSDVKKIVNEEDMSDRCLQVFLLENYLELDIGYYTLDTLYARRKNYKVVFDKTDRVEKIMHDTWEEMSKLNKGTTSEVDMKSLIMYIDSILWYNVIHCVNAFCRNNKYRCYYELNDIRNIAIDLIAKKNNIESKKHRDIELLNDNDKKRIDELFVYPNNKTELKSILIKLIEIIYENMDYFKDKENVSYTIEKQFLVKYVAENIL